MVLIETINKFLTGQYSPVLTLIIALVAVTFLGIALAYVRLIRK